MRALHISGSQHKPPSAPSMLLQVCKPPCHTLKTPTQPQLTGSPCSWRMGNFMHQPTLPNCDLSPSQHPSHTQPHLPGLRSPGDGQARAAASRSGARPWRRRGGPAQWRLRVSIMKGFGCLGGRQPQAVTECAGQARHGSDAWGRSCTRQAAPFCMPTENTAALSSPPPLGLTFSSGRPSCSMQ